MGDFRHINSEGVFDPSKIYSHVVVPPSGRTIFLAGQWGADRNGLVVDGGFAAQVSRAFTNVQIHLARLGIGPKNVLKLTHYVVGLDQEKRAVIHDVAGGIWPIDKPASTLLGVSCLARDDMFYEVDVQAVIPDTGTSASKNVLG